MYDFSDLGPNSKEMAIGILGVFILLVAIFGAGYLFGIRNAGTDIHDNGNGTGDVREQLGTAQEYQQQITDGIAVAETGAARVEAGIQQAAAATERAEAAVGDAARLIDSSQQILGRVRNRGKTGTAPH